MADNSQTFIAGSELSHETCEDVKSHLTALLEVGNPNITVDCQKTDTIDAHGLAILLMTDRTLRARGGKLSLSNIQPQWEIFFQETGLSKRIQLRS
jgi:anti-anti-sigma factor